jgi:hypothetical protein
VALPLSALLALYCGSTPHQNAQYKRFVNAKTQKAKRLAPDLVARAQRAHNKALLAEKRGESLVAQEYSTCAELLLEAAQVEAERIELERQRVRVQTRVDRANALQIRHRRARQNIEREIALIQAAQNSKPRDSLDFRETKKRNGKEQTRRLQQAARKRASELALQRAHLYLASAVAMGADEQMSTQVGRAIREAQSQPVGSASSARKAEQALLLALDALSAARAKNDGPTRDEINTLLSETQKEGFSVELLPSGIVVSLTGIFVGSSPALSDQGKVEMKKLLYLVRAHPHGAIEIRLHEGPKDRPNRAQSAKARAARIVTSLSPNNAQQARFEVVFEAFAPDKVNLVKMVFVAYGRTPQ